MIWTDLGDSKTTCQDLVDPVGDSKTTYREIESNVVVTLLGDVIINTINVTILNPTGQIRLANDVANPDPDAS